jgi:hypothetical protein
LSANGCGVQEKRFKNIIQRPLQQRRMVVASRFIEGKINTDNFLDEAINIRKFLEDKAPEHLRLFDAETQNTLDFLQTGFPTSTPYLELPEFQLLWGTAVATAVCDEEISKKWPEDRQPSDWESSEVWLQLSQTPMLASELAETQIEISGAVRRPVQVGWGEPPNGYPGVGYYFDLQNEYINLDLVWSLIIGVEHARAATMHELAHGQGTLEFTPRMKALYEQMEHLQENSAEWNKDDFITFTKLHAEWKARYYIWDEAENNYANRFAVNRGDVSAQDYSSSINFVESLLVGAVRDVVPPSEGEIEKKLDEVKISEKPDTDSGFKYFVNFKRALRYAFFRNNGFIDNTPEGWSDVNLDVDMLAQGLPDDKRVGRNGREILASIQEECLKLEETQPHSRERMFGGEFFQERILDCHRQRNDIIDQIFERHCAHLIPEIQREVENQAEQIAAIIDAIRKGIAEGKATIFIEGLGEISISDLPAADPKEARQGKDGESPGEAIVEKGVRTEKFEKPTRGSGPTKKEDGKSRGGGGSGPSGTYSESKSELPQKLGTFDDYKQIILDHGHTIRKLSRLFKDIQEKIRKQREEEFRRNTLMPEDGDLGRFDTDSLRDRLIRQFSGQSIDETDFEHFRRNIPQHLANPPAEIVIFMDGSGSMTGEPVNIAITAGCILYESAKSVGMKVWIAMLGEPTPLKIAKPGDSDAQIGERIAAVKKGQGGSKDFILPAVKLALEHTVDAKTDPHAAIGNTHFFVVSDGGFSDAYQGGMAALDKIKDVAFKCPHFTMDYVLIGDRNASIIPVAEDVNRRSGRGKIGYNIINGIDEIQGALEELLIKRLQNLPEGDAPSLTQKKIEFRQAHLRM